MATAQLMSMNELDEANSRLQEFEGSLPVRELDPNEIRVTKYANRHESHFTSKEFAALRDDIMVSGGNTVPIMVRPTHDGGPDKYEVIFGHRRLQACRDAGVKVLALIQDATDEEMFAMMVRENNEREDLSAYEEAISYKKALDEGLYKSQHAMSAAIGVSQGRISQVMAITKLPPTVLTLFSSPTNVQYRWAMELVTLLDSDRAQVMASAKDLKGSGARLSDKAIFDVLVSRKSPTKVGIKVNGKTQATLVNDANVVKVTFAKNVLTVSQTEQLAQLLEQFLVQADS
ncbi:MAG: ParB/RepB/Spo0J family partition protein [Burkholderiaceae bacterium]